ncbi:MAG: DUF2834 domain-containing protein [Stenotrophobium sp.]
MNTSIKSAGTWQEMLYGALAITGLTGAWAQALVYLHAGFLDGNIAFWKAAVTTPASLFIVVDIFVLAAALFVWMFAEGRRLGISQAWLWGYFLGSVFVAISFAFPLFLAHRQRLLRTEHPQQHAAPAGADFVGIALAVLFALCAVGYSFLHRPV